MPAPNSTASSRIGRSVTPAMGARNTLLQGFRPPICIGKRTQLRAVSVKEPMGNRKIYWTFFNQLSQVSKFCGDLFLAFLAITDGIRGPDLGLARGVGWIAVVAAIACRRCSSLLGRGVPCRHQRNNGAFLFHGPHLNFAAIMRASSRKRVQMTKKVDSGCFLRHTRAPVIHIGGSAHGGNPGITWT